MSATRPKRTFDASRAARATAKQSSQMLNTSPSRQPFSSPNPSVATLQESDGDDNSELDEDAKPNLNVITDFTHPKMPMKGDDLIINHVQSQQAQARRQKAISVVSHKGLQFTSTPPDDMPSLKNKLGALADLKNVIAQKSKPSATRDNKPVKRDISPAVQRIPIGITIPERDAQAFRDNLAIDSALALRTPVTPSIVITPANATSDWAFNKPKRPASSIYSAAPYDDGRYAHQIPPVPQIPSYAESVMDTHDDDGQCMGATGTRMSTESLAPIIPADTETSRPKSQGWWNVVLSPLLRNASVASKQTKTQQSTPPAPPLPFSVPKMRSSPISAHNDPNSAVSGDSRLSPDTPRRAGMANARESTWSRWTELEQHGNANDSLAEALDKAGSPGDEKDVLMTPPDQPTYTGRVHNNHGLAAEYFLACAVERATGQPYFECLHHSCDEQLPVLKSIYDHGGPSQKKIARLFVEPQQTKTTISDGAKVGDKNESSVPRLSEYQELSPNELSPNVRQADMATVFKAREIQSTRSSPAIGGGVTKAGMGKELIDRTDKPSELGQSVSIVEVSREVQDVPDVATQGSQEKDLSTAVSKPAKTSASKKLKRSSNLAAVPIQSITEKHMSHANTAAVPSPGPLSPEAQKSLALAEAVPMSHFCPPYLSQPQNPIADEVNESAGLPGRPVFVTHDTSYPDVPAQPPTAAVTARDIQEDDRFDRGIEKKRQRHEQEDAVGRKAGGLWRGRGCIPKKGCFGRQGREGRLRRRWIAAISALLVAIIVTCIVLAITLTRKGDNTPIQSQWLNLTGFPPIPTGISTIAVPNLQSFENRCVSPTTMWSCTIPKDSQDQLNGNDPTQPNFRFEIRFNNNTAGVLSNETVPLNGTGKSSGKTASDPFTNDLFTPNPSPPSTAEQIFLGNTTDNITQPFDGETTPFFITFLAAWPTLPSAFNDSNEKRSGLARRQLNNTSSVGNSIPAPSTNSDGTAANATLLPTDPYPFSQPLRIYNRGQVDEHYGFYVYYDKSVFLSGFDLNDTSSDDTSNNDQNGGSTRAQATTVCTFSQTRYLIKFFTNPKFSGSLLATPPPIDGESDSSGSKKSKNGTTSATNFARPGSFPYPASIILDRHGGDQSKKGVYCYGVEGGVVQKDVKIAVGEFIAAGGGTAINPAPALTGDSSSVNKSLGGIDGGSGGCQCTYQNWQ